MGERTETRTFVSCDRCGKEIELKRDDNTGNWNNADWLKASLDFNTRYFPKKMPASARWCDACSQSFIIWLESHPREKTLVAETLAVDEKEFFRDSDERLFQRLAKGGFSWDGAPGRWHIDDEEVGDALRRLRDAGRFAKDPKTGNWVIPKSAQ